MWSQRDIFSAHLEEAEFLNSPSLPSMQCRRFFSLRFAWLEHISRTSSSPVLKAVFSRQSRKMKKSSCVLHHRLRESIRMSQDKELPQSIHDVGFDYAY